MRARQPDHTGYAVNRGVRIYFEVHGHGEPTLLLLPAYQWVDSRLWKMQVPYLARRYRTVVYDPRGNGRSDRPATDYGPDAVTGDAMAVLDHLDIGRCGLVAASRGARTALAVAARRPEQVIGMVLVGGKLYEQGFSAPERYDAWKTGLRTNYADTIRWLASKCIAEPHSTKPHDDLVEWSLGTTADVLIAADEHGWHHWDGRELLDRVRCPALLIHSTRDFSAPYAEHALVAHHRLHDPRLVALETPGNVPGVRDPVKVNLLIREFFDGVVSGAM